MICTFCQKNIHRRITPNTKKPFCNKVCYAAWQKGSSFEAQGKKKKPPRLCDKDDCTTLHFGKGFCKKHYTQAFPPPKINSLEAKGIKRQCKNCLTQFIIKHKEAIYCSRICNGLDKRNPFIIKKGYKRILKPEHHRADGKGYVREHIVIAEKKYARKLKAGEEVHHIDFDKMNNSPENLILCKNHSEHMAYHRK